jgi:hypothetical protein
VPCRGQEGIHDLPLLADVGVGHRRLPDPAPGPAGELPGRLRGEIHHRSDLVERHVDDIVQDEGQPFGGGERAEL